MNNYLILVANPRNTRKNLTSYIYIYIYFGGEVKNENRTGDFFFLMKKMGRWGPHHGAT